MRDCSQLLCTGRAGRAQWHNLPSFTMGSAHIFSEECCVGESVLAGGRLAQVVPPAMPFFRAVKTTEDLDLFIIY